MIKVFRNFRIFIFVIIFKLRLQLHQGCSQTGGGTAMVIAEGDRTVGTVIDDTTIKLQIASQVYFF